MTHTSTLVTGTIKRILTIMMFLCTNCVYAQADSFGQLIQIETHLHSFVGKPSWLIIIRDIDHNQVLPYLFDIDRGDNVWVAMTYSKHYLITVSRLQIETYQSRYNTYKSYRLNNFCNLESNGRIIRGESMRIRLEGSLTPNRATSRCSITRYPDPQPYVFPTN